MGHQLRQPLALFPRCSDAWIGVPKPSQSSVKEFVCGRRAPIRALSIEGPAKNELGRTIMFSSHPSEPMVEECRLPNPCPGNNCDDIYLWICPGSVQEGDILLSPKNIFSSNG